MRTVLLSTAFLICLGVWTWKLLEPNPVPVTVQDNIPTDLKYIVSKMVHVGSYAFLTILAAMLPLPRVYFRGLIVGLAIHGIATEIGQRFVPNRNGSVWDVLFDWTGIGIGLLVIRLWRSRSAESSIQYPLPHKR